MSDPQDVDPFDACDRFDCVEPECGFDLDEYERLRVRLLDRRRDALGLPLVPHQQPEAAPAERWIAC
jgi:hypothetical protein